MTPLEPPPGANLAASLAARTEALCAIPSPIGSERAICDAVEAWARPRAAHFRRVKNSLVLSFDAGRDLGGGTAPGSTATGSGNATLGASNTVPGPSNTALGASRSAPGPRNTARPWVLLCGHLDTIPAPEPDRGRAPRREGGREGERLVATGASDMKGGLAVMLELAERLPAAGRAFDLGLVLYAREEGPFLENELGDVLREVPALAKADLAICLEPTDNRLQLGCVGSIHATFTFRGRSAHSARPWQGENAVHRAGPLLAELLSRPPRDASSGGLPFREVLSVTRIEGGRARNVVPDACSLNLNFRFAPDRALEEAAEELRALGARHGAEVAFTDLSPAAPAFADRPLVRQLAELSGAPPEPKQAWTDVARLAQAGIPAVNFGPGATAQAHQAGEWLELAALERCYRVLEGLVGASRAPEPSEI